MGPVAYSEESKLGGILGPPLALWALSGSSAVCILICNKLAAIPSFPAR